MSCPYGFTKKDLSDEAREKFEKESLVGKCPFGYDSEQNKFNKDVLSEEGKEKLEKLKTTGEKCPFGFVSSQ